jgi:hypothetical protein
LNVRRAVPLLLVAIAGFVAWLGLAVVTPYAIAHQPGSQNPTFGWYVLYHSLPLLFLLAMGLLLGAAWTLWRGSAQHVRRDAERMNAVRLSADGLYYWDGQRWASTLAADGRFRWNGTAWAPAVAGPANPYGYAPESASTRVVTSWTRPMQYMVAGWYGVQALFLATLPFWYISTMTRWADAMNRQNQQLYPAGPTPPPDLASNTNTVMTVLFYLMIVVLLAMAVVAIAGALRRWNWAYYGILALLGLEAIYLAFSVVSTLAVSLATSALVGQSVSPPALMVWAEVGFGIPSAALFVWMLIAIFQKGSAAMKNVTASSPAAS